MILPLNVSSGVKVRSVQNRSRSRPRRKQSAMLVKVETITERVSGARLGNSRSQKSRVSSKSFALPLSLVFAVATSSNAKQADFFCQSGFSASSVLRGADVMIR